MSFPLESLISHVKDIPDIEPIVHTYPLYNSGRFGGWPSEHDAQSDPLEPNHIEHIAINHLAHALETHEHVTALDLGAMSAFSLAYIGETLRNAYDAGRLTLIATNMEAFSIHSALAESQRRLNHSNVFSLLSYELADNPHYKKSNEFMDLLTSLRPIHSREELAFLEQTAHRVSYVQLDDTRLLPQLLQSQYQGTALQLVHEYYAGFEHQPRQNLESAAEAVRQTIEPGGIILTHKHLPIRDMRVQSPKNMHDPRSYYIYTKPR